MSQTSSSFGLPGGTLRAGFDAAARAHQAVREGRPQPAARPLAASGTPVEAAIATASQATGIDFNYLLAQAEIESALDPDAKAATSSATGLYQFIDSTWLNTVKKHGARFGLGAMADQIGISAGGSAHVADPAQRAAILALRSDPQVASLMAAGLAEDNRAHLAPVLGREPDHAELYLAHFLGSGGAARFLSELQADPGQSAPALFTKPAAANRAIFFAPDGAPRSLAQVMEVIGGKLENALGRAGESRSPVTTPYMVADQSVFGPETSPTLTHASGLPRQPRTSMSQLLAATFGHDPAAAPAQVRRAYGTLKAFGL